MVTTCLPRLWACWVWARRVRQGRRQLTSPSFFDSYAKFECQIWFGVIRWSYLYSVLEDSYYFGLKRIFEENKFFVRALEMAVSAGINCFFDLFVKCAFLPPFFNRWSDKKVHKTKNVKKGHISIPRTKGFDVKF